MAYIPPHRRVSNGNQDQLPRPAGSGSSRKNGRGGIWRCFTVGFAEDGRSRLPVVCLRTVSVDADEVNKEQGEEAMAIVKHSVLEADSNRNQEYIAKPWENITERLMQSLLPSVESVRKKMERQSLDSIKAHFVARAGTVLFLGREELNGLVDEASLGKLRRWFDTNVPSSYMDNIVADFVPKIGLQYGEFKDVFHVLLADKLGEGKSIIHCKCRFVEEEKRLVPYKMELQRVPHMRVDFSCLEKNVDLRLMLYTKITLTSLTDNEKRSIRDLIGSSIADPTVKGGIRWPFGRTTSLDNRYVVRSVCHTTTRDYVNSSMRLRVRIADKGDRKFSTSTGKVTREMTIKLKGICSHLMEKELETAALSDILKDEMKLLWDHFLQCEKFIAAAVTIFLTKLYN